MLPSYARIQTLVRGMLLPAGCHALVMLAAENTGQAGPIVSLEMRACLSSCNLHITMSYPHRLDSRYSVTHTEAKSTGYFGQREMLSAVCFLSQGIFAGIGIRDLPSYLSN
ncbi:hypothetical protein QBC47DRAFT_384762 [Echria macrotheca]|uniref:Uncharacterized protein n=1 Tax=Echria macrotheca TaxID=438768 RepID=A0AAJ0BDD7_9PEZI|nr:hypothetical protein QBC47DRAFT_384762 [Echria macrotheca]